MSWIRTIDPMEARGLLQRVYDQAVRRAGSVANILRAMSLQPRVLEASMGLYKSVMLARGPLTRRQREMLAVVVSRVNECHY